MAMKEDEEENGRGGQFNAVESHHCTIMYLVMPSYAEPYKQESSIFVKMKKRFYAATKLSKSFENIFFNYAFSNSKNIKQMTVRTND